ncbi:YajQ family cyclic di-GMP-binding protein [Candidatus Gracilibacteria bacterium]|nr:YajQ family cyclic di-GMP-binding protein [Candidatus Gracilibacteria bacterium]
MADTYSFDVVSEYDQQELTNALDQARREFTTRFDFKGITVSIEQEKDELKIITQDEFKLAAVLDVLKQKMVKRGISLKYLDLSKKTEPAANAQIKQVVPLKKGLKQELAKKITALLRDEQPKVKASIMAEVIRVTSKSKDDLQATMNFLRAQEDKLDVALQFTNFR